MIHLIEDKTMAEKWPYMPLYGKDFYDDSKVKVLSLGAQGLYVALLWRQWVDGSIPTNFTAIAKLIGQSVAEVKKYWPEVRQFFERSSGAAVNSKLEKVRSSLAQKRLAQQKGAAMTNAKRPAQRPVSDTVSVSHPPANDIAMTSGSPEGEREGEPAISYGQFLFYASKAAQWRNENAQLFVGGDDESFARAFKRGVGISLATFESWERQFEKQDTQ